LQSDDVDVNVVVAVVVGIVVDGGSGGSLVAEMVH
jgi:hypothetical protein